MRDQQDGAAVVLGQRLHAVDDFAARLLVQRSGGFVGQQHGRFRGQCTGDGDPLSLAAGQLFGLVVDALAQADRFQHLQRGLAPGDRIVAASHAQAQFHILHGAQCTQQIVLLEDETDLATDFFQGGAGGIAQFRTQYPHAARLRRSQCASQGKQGRFSGTRRSGDDDDFALANFNVDIEQDLLAQAALAVVVAEVLDDDWRGGHQNTSAGSSLRTLRTASRPEIAHMPRVSTNTRPARSGVTYKGRNVAAAARPYRKCASARPGK